MRAYKCDWCGSFHLNDDRYKVKGERCSYIYSTVSIKDKEKGIALIEKELCPSCMQKLLKLLKGEEK